jgi:hypothetical protein
MSVVDMDLFQKEKKKLYVFGSFSNFFVGAPLPHFYAKDKNTSSEKKKLYPSKTDIVGITQTSHYPL